ncbi:GRRM system radical SAM/SPASM domain protein [Dechloromonas sp. XY25]|uniref:GRRM system radical SAM/SPASM domain protein n=1 Tax=Dechloromonas hankyongensis TaxID=2908002 RepID=A0ABS9JZJ3_9RHOO|nr:cyclophane-forming radical SAM/SPASM peptide maturase GrrM/OscB [Dechloromonas hankyongensis]MCG2576308.1 GRRM system radical SAM/SPASM domain protein [Dechloromonas hankyongensis]
MVSTIRWSPRPTSTAVRSEAASFAPADFFPALRTRLLILQPTPFCNLDCDYCYLPQRDAKARMSLETVRKAARRLVDDGLAGAELTVVWHAGEPLTVPPSFYDEAIPLIADVLGASCAVSHSIQTNATLIDDAWCRLFTRHGVRIGISVDGPAWLHDRHRRTRRGQTTHQRVVQGMARLREHGIPYHAIAVVTAETLGHADAFCDFFLAQGIHEVGCNFDEAEGVNDRSSLADHEPPHARFVERLLARSIESGGSLRFRELEMAMHLIAEPLASYRWRGRELPDNAQTLPFALITVAHNGDFTTFSPELLGQPSPEYGDFVLGNVHADSFLDSARHQHFVDLWTAIRRGTGMCEASCAYFGFCGGGAPANKLYENGDLASAETLYCRTMLKRPFDAVLARLERDAAGDRKDSCTALAEMEGMP